MLVLLYVLDCLRPDMLGCYGSELGATPTLDQLAEDSVLYQDAYANSSWSFPSLVSMLTSQYPRTLKAQRELSVIPPYAAQLPELLSQAGFTTVGISASSWFAPEFGVRGFDRYYPVYQETELIEELGRMPAVPADRSKGATSVMAHSEDLNRHAVQALQNDHEKDRDLFLMVWSLDTHPPYYLRGSSSRYGNTADDFYRDGEADHQKLRSLYSDMLFYNDATLGDLLAEIKSRDLYQKSLIMVLGDHGVSFGEHGISGHGRIVYQEQIHVPLLIKYPDFEGRGSQRKERVHLADIMPTVLDCCQLDNLKQEPEGISLHPKKNIDQERLILCESHQRPTSPHSAAVLKGKHKYLMVEDSVPPESASWRKKFKHSLKKFLGMTSHEKVYDLSAPHGENDPVEDIVVQQEMREVYQKVLLHCQQQRETLQGADHAGKRKDSQTFQVDPEVKDRLKFLGYLEDDQN